MIGEGALLTGFKFAIQSGQRPVYRRRRFEFIDGLLSGPAVAGLLAVVAARRNAFRAWLSESAFRSVVVGALAVSVGVQAGSAPSGAQRLTKGHDSPSHCSTAGQAAGGGGFAAGFMKASESGASKRGGSDGDRRANAGNLSALAEPAPFGMEHGQGWRLPDAGAGAASALGKQTDLLIDIGLYNLPGSAGSNSNSGGSANDDHSASSSKPDSASASSNSGSFSSGSSALPPDRSQPGAEGVAIWQAVFSPSVLAERLGRGSIVFAGRSGPHAALRSPLTFAALLRGGPGAESADLGAPALSRGLPTHLDAPRPGGVPEPATWAIMLTGLALVGGAARHPRGRGRGWT